MLTPMISIGALPEWNEDPTIRLGENFVAGEALLVTEIDLDKINTGAAPIPELTPDPIVVRPQIIIPTPATPENHSIPPADDKRILVPIHILENYFSEAINEGFTDPQKILTAEEIRDTQAALELYSEESPVSIYLYIFNKNQRVPNSLNAENIFNTFYYSEPSAVVVYYFMEEPERCQVHFGGKDSNMIATNKIRDLVSGIKLGAKKRSNRSSQLDEFIKQLSLHMFWIEKAMIDDIYTPLISLQEKNNSKRSGKASIPEKVVGGISSFSNYWWIIAGSSILLIVALLLGVRWVSNRKYPFPSIVVNQRLNLPNGGSSGGILSFKDQDVPPSAQREQFNNPFN